METPKTSRGRFHRAYGAHRSGLACSGARAMSPETSRYVATALAARDCGRPDYPDQARGQAAGWLALAADARQHGIGNPAAVARARAIRRDFAPLP